MSQTAAKGSGRVRQSRGRFVADGTGPVSHSRAVRRLIPLAAAEIGGMREIDRRLATGHGDLLEEHLGLDAVPRPPVAKASLQRPRLTRVKLLRVTRP